MTIPKEIRAEIRDYLWVEADRINWASLSTGEKSRLYTQWTESRDVGGKLGAYMDPRQIRVYLKDTLLKSYTRERMADPRPIFRVLEIEPGVDCVQTFIKPHGRELRDGRVIAWSRATEWKLTLLAVFERAFGRAGLTSYAAVLLETSTRHADIESRKVVEAAAERLGIQHVAWLD